MASQTHRSRLAALAVGLFAVGAIGYGLVSLTPATPSSEIALAADQPRVRAPEFPADLDWLNTDQPLQLADFRGKVVLLDFWTYCCINCMHILPELKKLEQKWDEELVVLGVHSAKFLTEGETESIREAILRYDIEHPVINDKDFTVWNNYAVRAWPSLVLIDPSGRIVGQQSGEITFEQFDPVIQRVVQEAERNGTLQRGPVTFALERQKTPASLLSYPGKVLADPAGDRLIIADSTHNRYLITSLVGEITHVIGSGQPGFDDGSFAEATFRKPQGMTLVGDKLYLADTENHALRVADLTAATVTTLVGTGRKPTRYNQAGVGRAASLHSPWDVLHHGGKLYVANAGSHQIWTVDPGTGEAKPFAGSGREDIVDGPRFVASTGPYGADPNRSAALAQPSGLTTDGTWLYFADSETSALRRVRLDGSGNVESLLGQGLFEFGDVDGPRPTARLQHPLGVAYRDGGIYLADTYNDKIKRYDLESGKVTTYAGTGVAGVADGPVAQARFNEPGGVSVGGDKLYVADTNNSSIRVIDLVSNQVATLRLTGLDKVAPSMEEESLGPNTTVVDLPATTATAGQGRLLIELQPPTGYKLNPGAPLLVRISAKQDGVVVAAEPKLRLKDAHLPVEVPVELNAGTTDLQVVVDGYVCREDGSGSCLLASVAYKVPVTVTADAKGADIHLPYAMPTP